MNKDVIINNKTFQPPVDYPSWKDGIIQQIHTRQLRTMLNVNADTLQNYGEISGQIL